jgi:hypothetical protein
MHRRLLAFGLLSALAIVGAPSCADTLDGDGDGEDGGSGGGSGSKSCEDFEDADGDIVEIKFHNNSVTEEIYISTWCNIPERPAFTLLRVEDESEVKIDSSCEAFGTCGDMQSDREVTCTQEICEVKLFKVDPGATYTFPWPATEQVLAQMQASCYDETKKDMAGPDCWHKIPLREEALIATGEYYNLIDVEQGAGCPCTVSTAMPGVCEINPATCDLYSGNPALPEVIFHPGSDSEIVFEL